jgi:hypothetical protein
MRLRERKTKVNASASSKIKANKSLTESKMQNYHLTKKNDVRNPVILQVKGK